MADETQVSPELKRVLDKMMHAGWLEQFTDKPDSPNKTITWTIDAINPSGEEKLLAWNVLYSELTKTGPLTEQDLIIIEVLVKELRKRKRGTSN